MKQIFESDRISFVKISELLINDYLIMINDNENVKKPFTFPRTLLPD